PGQRASGRVATCYCKRAKINPVEINVGGHAKFDCETEDAPNVTFKWYKSNIEIKQSEKYRIISRHTGSSLELLNPVKADSGEYTCKASNQHGSDSCTASLIVTGKIPVGTFFIFYYLIVTVLGKLAQFQCVVVGSPTLSVQWQKDESWILEDPRIERTFENNVATLRISACEASHSGRYSCQVINEAGQDKCFGTLTVQGNLLNQQSLLHTFHTYKAISLCTPC
uniref:Ig-like domain-containing protein n=1 Tax=Poecilia reticulata TaxID=8081 RepID=A0A3P9PZK9_POERE